MRSLLKLISALCFAFALILLIADGTAMLAEDGFVATPLAATIGSILPGMLEALQLSVQQYTHPLLWDPALTVVLSWPGWAVLGAVGLLLALIGRSRPADNTLNIEDY